MTDLKDLIARCEWTSHVFREGSREHVFVWGILADNGTFSMPITWCSSPFCIENKRMLEQLIDMRLNPLDAQPPPRLRLALEAMTIGNADTETIKALEKDSAE